MSLEELLGQRGRHTTMCEAPVEDQVTQLKSCLKSLHNTHDFKVGDLVVQKPFLGSRRFPTKKLPGIITQVLDEPVMDSERESSSCNYRNTLDVVVGVLDNDGDFFEFHLDSRRLEPFTPELTPEPSEESDDPPY